jgi:hypothetical protein
LLTYSGQLALPAPARRGLLDCIARLIDPRYLGRIRKRYFYVLQIAGRFARRASG